MVIDKNKIVSMDEAVYQKLKTALAKRYIRPNSQLVETTIAEQLGVSRTPVRAALKRMVYDGFVQMIPNKGAFVVNPSIDEIHNAFVVRSCLEQKSAYLAAQNFTKAMMPDFSEMIAEEKRISEARDVDEYYSLNDKFHFKIAEISANPMLNQYVQEIISRTNIFLVLFDPFFQIEVFTCINEHQDIINALQNNDSEGCAKAMEKHLRCTLEEMNLAEIGEKIPEDFLYL